MDYPTERSSEINIGIGIQKLAETEPRIALPVEAQSSQQAIPVYDHTGRLEEAFTWSDKWSGY